jgi:hypothetical protein
MGAHTVVLEEGFDGDDVAVRVGDEIAYSSDRVTTRPQIGVAQRTTRRATVRKIGTTKTRG